VIVTYEEVFSNVWSIGQNSSFPSWLIGELVLILPTRGSCLLYGEIYSRGGCLRVSDPRESSSMILYFTGDLVDDLNSRGVPLVAFDLLKDAFDAFHSLGML